MDQTTAIDHSRGLCGKPDVSINGTPREAMEVSPAHCLCCGSKMLVEDCTSEGMNQLGMYWLICPICPAWENKQAEQPNSADILV